MGAGERTRIEPADMRAPPHLAADQAGMLQHPYVLGGRRERHRKGFRELAHRALAAGEIAQHLPPRGVAERVEHRVHLRGL